MISFFDHFIWIISFPHTVILSTVPHAVWSFSIPCVLWLSDFSIRSKIREPAKTVLTLIILFLHIVTEKGKVSRKAYNNILFYLFIAGTTGFIGHFNAEDFAWHFKSEIVELSHLFTVLLTDFRVTRTVTIRSDFFLLSWYW